MRPYTRTVSSGRGPSWAVVLPFARPLVRRLRTASRLPGIRRQVDTIVLSLPRLFDVAMLGGFSSEVWTQPLLLMTWQFANFVCLLH